jgi:hypothetical protein
MWLLCALLIALARADDLFDTKVEGSAIRLRERVGETMAVGLPESLAHITNIDIPEAVGEGGSGPSRQICSVQEPGI